MLLYHYCSNDTFLKIVEEPELWLSELTQSNDSMEGKWAGEVLLEAWNRLGYAPDIASRIARTSDLGADLFGDLGFCMSRKDDVLSQWRGYAANGEGVAIGFDEEALKAAIETENTKYPEAHGIEIIIYNIEYNYKIGDSTIEKVARDLNEKIRELCDDNREDDVKIKINTEMKISHAISNAISKIGINEKNPAFEEESESRLHIRIHKGKITHGERINFRSRGAEIVPYFIFPITKGCIKEIILGPRNRTPEPVIRAALEKYGFHNVDIKPSKATYR
jgi:hypothetical protein